MLIVGVKPGHDGAIAVIQDRKVVYMLESEKDTFARHAPLTPMTMFGVLEDLDATPDVIAIGGWQKEMAVVASVEIETGYRGDHQRTLRDAKFCGQPTKAFSSTHVRSHIMMAAGMAPPDDEPLRAILVWEGAEGSFYLVDEGFSIVRRIPVLDFPGGRYVMPFLIADPSYGPIVLTPGADAAGKLMALAGFADSTDADGDVKAIVDQILEPDSYGRFNKGSFSETPLYNAGVQSDISKMAAALIQDRIFEIFSRVALREIPSGIPLYISGGCGLNCDWNSMWRNLGHFSSVFVPPCTNDSGSALGTALDALYTMTGDPRAQWDVYCGREPTWDRDPWERNWRERPLDDAALADALADGRVVAWVQGRWEIGPRALGNRSLLADPRDPRTRDRLNEIKQREGYRPIAPVCRIEDAGKVFDSDFHDPYMLYFRMVTSPDLGAVTHVDGSARAQTVTRESNRRLHDLLSTFADRHGVGVLCNTSLNYKNMGFINRSSDLQHYCDTRGIDDFVIGDRWFQRTAAPARRDRPAGRVAPLPPEVATPEHLARSPQ